MNSTVRNSLLRIGKGLKGPEFPGRAVNSNYWFAEVSDRGNIRPRREIDILKDCWESDTDSNLSFPEWEEGKKAEWSELETEKEFLPWLAESQWESRELKAWESANPEEDFSETKLSEWRETQVDDILGPPTWLLKELSNTDNPSDFAQWREKVVSSMTKFCGFLNKKTGLDLTVKKFEQLQFKYDNSGSLMNSKQWILHQTWQESASTDDFPVYAQKLKWQQETNSGETSDDFENWSYNKEQARVSRYEGSKLPLSYEEWSAQQDDRIIAEPSPFLRLDTEKRKPYRTTCSDGKLTRNDQPLNTAHEITAHSGQGYAIFVIGPKEDLYTSSHVMGVFHHSSFLGDGATMAAGEIKTDENGEVTDLSSKSGHYHPTDRENIFMLRHFKDKGVDLSKVTFTAYGAKGTEEYNAQDYLDKLEYIESLMQMDTDLFE
jgi:hypothetical protein